MQKIVGTKISLTRGDTLKVKVSMVKPNGSEYIPDGSDSIRFAMKKHYEDTSVLIEKTIPNDTRLLWLEPSDTKPLEFGTYVYDIQLTHSDGDVDTFIDRAIFELTEEVI